MNRLARRRSGSRFGSRGLERKRATREPLRRFLVVCEGAVTEKQYIEAVKTELRYSPIEVEVRAGDPNTAREMATFAAQKKRSAADEAIRLRDASIAYDEVWCAFDGGEHPHEDEALIIARDNGIHLAISSPSVELWVLTHLVKQNASLTAKQALSLCHKHKLMSDKHIIKPIELYKKKYNAAHSHCDSLRVTNARNGTPRANPSSDFDLLVESIWAAKKQAAI